MKKSFGLTIAILLGFFLLLCTELSPSDRIMTIDQIKPGMKGYGKTVFKGTQIETFPVTVLGVLQQMISGTDVILIRVDGGFPIEHHCGIIAGMSGSPVYINGKLIGAVAYGWSFPKEAIGGVTPIKNMLNCLQTSPLSSSPENFTCPVSRSLPQPVTVKGKTYRKITLSPTPVNSRNPLSDTIVLSPVSPYLQFSGFSSRSLKFIKKELNDDNLLPLGGGVSSFRRIAVPPLVPGSAVGVQLMSGDLDISGTGTLTYRQDNQFLAFGHTFLNGGAENFPMTAAYIEGVFPSYERSFKLASQIKQVGALRFDGLWAVAGSFHQPSEMISSNINIIEGRRKKTFRLKVIQHRNLTPQLLSFALLETLNQFSLNLQDKTAWLDYEIEAVGMPKIAYHNLETGSGDLDFESVQNLFGVLSQLSENKFSPLKYKKINLTLTLTPGRRSAALTKIWVNQPSIKPGETLELTAQIKTYQGEEQNLKVEIPIPGNLDKGRIVIGAGAGHQAEEFFGKLGQKKPQVSSLQQLVQDLEKGDKNHQLIIKVILPRSGTRIANTDFPLLPASLAELLAESPDSEIETVPETLTYKIDTDYYLEGEQTLFIPVEDNQPKQPGLAPEAQEQLYFNAGAAHHSGSLTVSNNATSVTKLNDQEPPKVPDGGNAAPAPGSPAGSEDNNRLSQFNDFLGGEFDNCGLTLDGKLFLSGESQELYQTPAGTCWNLAVEPNGDRIYFAPGNRGEIYQLDENHQASLLAKLPEIMISALALDPQGGLWAGCAPTGGLYHLDEAGNLSVYKTNPPVGYVWDIAMGEDGLYLAAGNPGKILHLLPGGSWQSLLPDNCNFLHIRKIIFNSADKSLIFLSSEPNGIYRLREGLVTPLWQSKDELTDLCAGSDSRLWAACGNQVINLTSPDYCQAFVYTLPEKIYSLAGTADGNTYAGAMKTGRIYQIDPQGNLALVNTQKSLSAIKLSARENDLYAAFTLPARIVQISPQRPSKGTYTTQPKIESFPMIWSKIRALSETPQESKITYQTQTSGTFSKTPFWSKEKPLQDETPLNLNPSQILQLRLNLYAGKDNSTPLIDNLEIFSGPVPQPPQVQLNAPAGGEKWAAANDISWQLVSPGIPAYSFDLSVSPAQGEENWTPLETFYSPVPDKSGNYKYSWDTTTAADGMYLLKLGIFAANDKIKTDPLEYISKPFYVCNTPPEIKIVSRELKDDQLIIKGSVESPLLNITEIDLRINQGEWQKIFCDDLIFDSRLENFTYTLPNQNCRLEIQAKDEAGNTQYFKTEISELRKG